MTAQPPPPPEPPPIRLICDDEPWMVFAFALAVVVLFCVVFAMGWLAAP